MISPKLDQLAKEFGIEYIEKICDQACISHYRASYTLYSVRNHSPDILAPTHNWIVVVYNENNGGFMEILCLFNRSNDVEQTIFNYHKLRAFL